MVEEVIKESTPLVLRYILPNNWSEKKKSENPIAGEDVVEAIKKKKAIEIINAVIDGPFILKNLNVEVEVKIQQTKIRGPIDFSYAIFKKVLNFNNSIFETNATFLAVTVEKDIFLDKVTFLGIATFSDISVLGVFYSSSTKFKNDAKFSGSVFEKKVKFNGSVFEYKADFGSVRIGGNADFNRAVFKQQVFFKRTLIEGSAFFKTAIFEGRANFGNAKIGDNAEFTGAVFKEQAFFNRVQIKGTAFFNPSVFMGDADFISARIGSQAIFNGTKFMQKAVFGNALIEESANFLQTNFCGIANFIGVRILNTVEFTQTVFKQKADFNVAQIEGTAFFNQSTFKGDVDFIATKIGSSAYFNGAVFKQQALFNRTHIMGTAFFNSATFENEANFVSTRIAFVAEFTETKFKGVSFSNCQIEESAFFNPSFFEGDADFSNIQIGNDAFFNGAEFCQLAKFDNAKIKMDTHFERTIFFNDVNFKDASLKTIYFGKPEVKFHGKIDLRGCKYEFIDPDSSWKKIMGNLYPYDRHPFTHLEATFRRSGKDNLADDVYYDRKCREFKENITIKTPRAWLLDRLQWLLTGYGVRLYNLFLAILIILFIGTCIFHLEGAVIDIQQPSLIDSNLTLNVYDSFWVSFNTFLPIEIPSGKDWESSTQIIPLLGIKFTSFATFMNIAGWILVPLVVAGITGLLKRSG